MSQEKEALGVNSVKFTGEVLKNVKMATYEINMKEFLKEERLLDWRMVF